MRLSAAQKARLGLFVVSGAALVAGTVLLLAGLRFWEQRDSYFIEIDASVSGLEESSQVRYQGLRIGRVEKMGISEEDPRLIRIEISVEAGTALYEGTEAVLALSGITGLKTVNLVPGDPRAELIPPGSQLPAGYSLMDKLTDNAEAIAAKVARVADQLADWTSPENRNRVERILDNVESLTGTVDDFLVDGKGPILEMVTRLSGTAVALDRFARSTTSILDDNREDIHKLAGIIHRNLRETHRILAEIDERDVAATVRAARGAMESIDDRFGDEEFGKLVSELRMTLTGVTRLLGDLDLAARASREDFVLALKRVREASEDLREFSRIIAQDPSVLVRGTELGE